jgi:hypothetical protein
LVSVYFQRWGWVVFCFTAFHKLGGAVVPRTHVGMSKGLDLAIKEQEGTSHQAALVIGGIHVINTGIGYGQYSHSKGVSAQRGE